MKKIIYLFLFSLILTTLFFNKPVSAYENTKYGFTIDPPPTWKVGEDIGTDGIFVDFINSDTGAIISVATYEDVWGTFEDFVNENKEELAEYFDNYNLVSEKNRVIGGLDCYELAYTWTHHDIEMKAKTVFFIESGVAYWISGSSFESDYSDHLDDFENTITSFRLTDDAGTWGINVDLINRGIIIFCLIVAILLIVYFFIIKKEKDPQTIEKKLT